MFRVLGFKTVFFSFSMQSHAEPFRNFVKSSVLDPKRAKLDHKSPFGVSGGQGFPPKIPLSFKEHLVHFSALRSSSEIYKMKRRSYLLTEILS